jgi:hypothetical protein
MEASEMTIEQQLELLKEKAEKFFEEAGKDKLEIFRIEKFTPIKVEQKFHGKFYQGDSYVLLKRNERDYDIHYWHGKEATMVTIYSYTLIG